MRRHTRDLYDWNPVYRVGNRHSHQAEQVDAIEADSQLNIRRHFELAMSVPSLPSLALLAPGGMTHTGAREKEATIRKSKEILECMPNLKSAFRHAALRQCDPEQTGLWESGRVAWDLAAHVMPLTLALSTRQRSDGLMTT